MKQNDIILVIIAVFIGGVLSVVLSSTIFGASKRNESVEVVETISSDFKEPDNRYFNSSSFNPTQNIQIGTGGNNVNFGE